MLRLSGSLINQPVLSLRLGGPIAVTTAPLIDPHGLKILGWWCKVNGGAQQILLNDHVRENGANGLAVDDNDALSDPDELVRHKEVVEIQFELIGKLVKTKRSKLGKVSDYSYNEGLFVQKIYVARPMVKIFTNEDTLIIDRTQILEITDSYILVKDTEVKVTEEELESMPAEAAPA